MFLITSASTLTVSHLCSVELIYDIFLQRVEH